MIDLSLSECVLTNACAGPALPPSLPYIVMYVAVVRGAMENSIAWQLRESSQSARAAHVTSKTVAPMGSLRTFGCLHNVGF